MKYMSWGWKQYLEAPDYIVDEIKDIMREEWEEQELRRTMAGS